MRRYISNYSGIIRIPEYARNEVQQYKKLLREYRKYYGKDPTEQEVAGFLGVSIKKLETIKNNVIMTNVRSLNEPIAREDENVYLEDFLASEQELEEDAIKKVDTAAMCKDLWDAVDSLPDDMPDVIRYRYKSGLTLKQSGEQIGVTIEAVRQKEAKALRQLTLPSVSRKFKPYYEEYMVSSIRHVGLSEFNRTWFSEVELAVLGF